MKKRWFQNVLKTYYKVHRIFVV